ncbi:MAG: AarF/ABC1/UbiB kinase family protein, partial [Chloroflexota bacterium]|nr:AarF/ABC1/UbiB kinase family protein [Chloroflexota bacterium]
MNHKAGLGRTYQHMNRYREIVTVLVKYGFEDFISKIHLEKYIIGGEKRFPGDQEARIASLSRWERIRMALEELGTTFIKLGQIMSNRPDLLPQKLLVQLERLQDSVPPFPNEEARQLIEEELG